MRSFRQTWPRDRELGTTPRFYPWKPADPKYCTGRIMAIKKGINHSNNKEGCSAGNLDDLLLKYCKSRYADLSCSDVHWNFWRMCKCTMTRKRSVTDTGWLFHRFGEEEAQMFKKGLQSLFCILHPACVLLSVCSLHFTLSLHFTRGPQSAVCSPQSTFYTDRFDYTCKFHRAMGEL